jgi:hypothetical protein
VREDQTFQPDGELDVAGANHVLDLEVLELGRKSEFLNNPGVLPGRESGVLLGLGAGADHLAGAEDQGGRSERKIKYCNFV